MGLRGVGSKSFAYRLSPPVKEAQERVLDVSDLGKCLFLNVQCCSRNLGSLLVEQEEWLGAFILFEYVYIYIYIYIYIYMSQMSC